MHKVRERERELEKVDQSQTHGYVLRFEHTSLRPRLHTEGFSLSSPHRTSHTGNLHWGYGQLQFGSTQLLSQQYNLSLEARHKPTQYQPHRWGIGTKPNNHNHLTLERFQHNLHYHLSLEGYQHNHLSLEGYHKSRRVNNLVVSTSTN